MVKFKEHVVVVAVVQVVSLVIIGKTLFCQLPEEINL